MNMMAIDGNSIMNRAFYGIKALTNKNGDFTNALVGFLNIYLKAFSELSPEYVVVAFDLHAKTFRHNAVASYKANRKGMPPELQQQMPIIKEILTALGITVLELEGFEADDILGTLSKICTDSKENCYILTGDRDSLQLINDHVTVRLATTKETILFTPDRFLEEYGFPPINLIDLKALMGDSSDNISGVPGVGEKTAMGLIRQYNTVENVYKNLAAADVTKLMKTKLEAGADAAATSKFLATIIQDVPISNDISSYKITAPDTEKLTAMLSSLQMFTILERLLTMISKIQPISVDSISEAASTAKSTDISLEVLPFSEFSYKDASIIDFIFTKETLYLRNTLKLTRTTSPTEILSFFESPCHKRTFMAKDSYKYAFKNAKRLQGIIFDAEIASYLLNSIATDTTIQRLCLEHNLPYYENLDDFSDVASLSGLSDKLFSDIKSVSMENLLNDIELPLTEVLASMEYTGISIDPDGVKSFGDILKAELTNLEQQIYENAGGEKFNISSPKQVSNILFEKLGLPCKKKTKTGYSTDNEILEGLMDLHPIIGLVLQFRQLSKLNSTYVEGLLKVVCDDKKIHSNFKQTETRTGRISSTNPNMQNIPVRTDLGKNLRRFFVAGKGRILLDADYSQIELRILSAICDDKAMQKAFNDGIDIHTATAADVFNMPINMVTPSMRRAAKAVNFGIVYGIGAFSLSKDIGVSVPKAKAYINEYLAHYPNVGKFMDNTIASATENGYVTTIFGRRRYIPELAASSKVLQAFGKRAAMNAPIQGSAADIIKIAMVRVYNRLRDENLDAKLILQVHDELIIESCLEDSDACAKLLQEEMENAVSLAVPLTAEVSKGYSWYDAKI